MGSCTVHTLGNVQRFYASPLQWVVLHDPESKKVVKGTFIIPFAFIL